MRVDDQPLDNFFAHEVTKQSIDFCQHNWPLLIFISPIFYSMYILINNKTPLTQLKYYIKSKSQKIDRCTLRPVIILFRHQLQHRNTRFIKDHKKNEIMT